MSDVITLAERTRTKHLMPSSSTNWERGTDLAIRDRVIPVPLDTLWNPWECPLHILPILAWTLSVDEWDSHWSEQTKRSVVAASVEVHRTKGTLGAVERALEAMGLKVLISEWFDYDGDPYRFRVDVIELIERGLNDAEIRTIYRVINQTKNVRSWLDTINIYITSLGEVPKFGGALLSGHDVVVLPLASTELASFAQGLFIGAAHYGAHVSVVLPFEVPA